METADLRFKPISLEDKPLFDRFFNDFSPQASEYTFTNLFVFKETRPIEFTIIEEHLLISFFDENKKRKFFAPVGKTPEIIIKKILELFQDTSFERIEKRIMENADKRLKIIDDRNNYDYAYKISDLIELPGQNYATKRNFISGFENNRPKTVIIDEKIISDCLMLEEEWCNLRKCKDDKGLCAEYLAIHNALTNYKTLNLSGIAVIIDGKVLGFAIGEKLNDDTFVEHFEKANSELRGAYQYVLNAFAKNIPKKFVYLNREQDLGIDGLRKAKLSYHPVRMIEKDMIRSNN